MCKLKYSRVYWPESLNNKQTRIIIVNFPFLGEDVPRSAFYGVYIAQVIRFSRVSSHVDDFNTRNKLLYKVIDIIRVGRKTLKN